MEVRSAAFPTEFLLEKNREILENNPVDDKVTNGAADDVKQDVAAVESNKRKLDDNDFDDDDTEKENGKGDSPKVCILIDLCMAIAIVIH